jgi:hypothetical protein
MLGGDVGRQQVTSVRAFVPPSIIETTDAVTAMCPPSRLSRSALMKRTQELKLTFMSLSLLVCCCSQLILGKNIPAL